MKSYKNVLCVAPFNSIFINKTIAKTCCAIDTNWKTEFLVNPNSTIDELTNKVNNKLRQDFIDTGLDDSNINESCVDCNSRIDYLQREGYNAVTIPEIDYIKNPTLSYLHIDFSNICNLACRICNSKSSSLLYDESRLLKDTLIGVKIKRSVNENSVLYKSILDNLDKVRQLRFSGGEPLLHEEVWNLLKVVYDKGYSKDIVFKVNTNGTIKLSKEKYDILKSFKEVIIDVSMDGIDEHAEYIRTNIIWDRWIANLKEYQNEFKNYSNFNLTVSATISVFNVHIFDKIKTFFNNMDIQVTTNMLFNPEYLCAYNINQRAKDYLTELYKNDYPEILHFINIDNKIDPIEVVNFIDKKDNIVIANNLYKNYRAFRDVDPEWYAMLKG